MQNETNNAGQVVPVKIVASPGAKLPLYATEQSAGGDLCAHFQDRDEITLASGAWALIPTGLFIQLPPGYEAQIRPRSGLALKHGVTVLNAPGTIDADYRGEIGVLLVNHSAAPFEIKPGDRIAQMVIAPYCRAEWQAVEALDSSSRGAGGFGSTGK
jgi:dUTP pyrophosphatase